MACLGLPSVFVPAFRRLFYGAPNRRARRALGRNASSARAADPSRRRVRPCLEALEDRITPSTTFTPTVNTDGVSFNGQVNTLRDAILAANRDTGTGTDTIQLQENTTYTLSIANSAGQTVFTGNYSASAGNDQPFTWNGQGNDGTQWPDGQYTMTATAVDATGNSVAVSTEISGTVNSVDLTQSPPLLSIQGQNYTVSQIKRIGT